jgi:hypothetical protein
LQTPQQGLNKNINKRTIKPQHHLTPTHQQEHQHTHQQEP